LKKLAGLLALLLFSNANAKTLHYLYIEANEGTASGGHAALQLDDTVFHYQYRDGLIRLTKDDSAGFDFDYRYLQNRTLRVADIAVADESFAVLQDYFKRQFWEQDRQFKQLQTLENDTRLLDWFINLKTPPQTTPQTHPRLSLPAAGLFYNASDFDQTPPITGACQTQAAADNVLGALRQRHGAEYLTERSRELTESIQRLSPSQTDPQNRPSTYGFSQRYLDLVNASLAIQVLRTAKPLAVDACHALESPDGRLDNNQRQSLQRYQQQLLQSANVLLTSNRPDWGQALLISLARLVTIEQSLQSGRWFFLDDFEPLATTIDTEQYTSQAEAMQQKFLATQRLWHQRWQALSIETALDDAGYTDLEIAANQYREWQTSRTRQTLRYQGQQRLPLKPLPLPAWIIPNLSDRQLQLALQAAQQRTATMAGALQAQYAYELLSRNCVTELFHGINLALGSETEQILGGRLNPVLQVIPFVAFASLSQQNPASQIRLLPSLRQQRLAKQYAEEFAPWVFARESNLLTAELYQYNPDDAAFLFFTDDSVLARPLFGAFNLLTGLGQSLWGLLQLPFDAGDGLHNGARGLLMSLPELVFINIRKGSYKFVPEQ
jgi:hypothetical protein